MSAARTEDLIVVDASATVELLFGTELGRGVAQVLSSVAEAHAPELIDPEVIAVIRKWTLRRWIDDERGTRAIHEFGDLRLVRHRHTATRSRTWELRDRFTAYDACYVALAEALNAQLLTTDMRLARAAHGLVELAALP